MSPQWLDNVSKTHLDTIDANTETARGARPVIVENGGKANVAHLSDAERGLFPYDRKFSCNHQTLYLDRPLRKTCVDNVLPSVNGDKCRALFSSFTM